jgi:hypothetical protein
MAREKNSTPNASDHYSEQKINLTELDIFPVEERGLRTSFVFLFLMVLVSFSLQIRVNAQTNYVTVYGQLTQFQCPVGVVSGPCTGLSLTTNGTTPGIPNHPMLDFSQSVVPAPVQSDVGKLITATGYYSQESPCMIVNSCPAFFVHTWVPYYGQSVLTTSSKSTAFLSSSPSVYLAIAIALAVLLGYLHFCRKKRTNTFRR